MSGERKDLSVSWIRYTVGPYLIGGRTQFSAETCRDLSTLIERGAMQEREEGRLSGREIARRGTVAGIGPCIAKSYARGGLLGLLIRDRHLRLTSDSRARHEFTMLEQVRALGLPAPEPIAWITRGTICYRAWLVMREVPHETTLASLAFRDHARTEKALDQVVEQIRLLVQAQLFHVDLHPGNVLVNTDGNPIIVDFDKAIFSPESPARLRDRYIVRWRRAVIKHELPEFLTERMSLGLRRTGGA